MKQGAQFNGIYNYCKKFERIYTEGRFYSYRLKNSKGNVNNNNNFIIIICNNEP